VTLTRLILAWAVVAAWFVAAAFAAARLLRTARPSPAALSWRAAEALVATLLGSLWFESLGHGEWWLVFLLVGALVTLSEPPTPDASRRTALVVACAGVVRYVVAGAILAWRLG
jgi:hypothetical protein